MYVQHFTYSSIFVQLHLVVRMYYVHKYVSITFSRQYLGDESTNLARRVI